MGGAENKGKMAAVVWAGGIPMWKWSGGGDEEDGTDLLKIRVRQFI